jgi:hypothetical protein
LNKIVELDREPWHFILFEVDDDCWVVDFYYSPKSYVDSSLTIHLTDEEKLKTKNNRQFLVDFSIDLMNNPNKYFDRSEDYSILLKNSELNGSS